MQSNTQRDFSKESKNWVFLLVVTKRIHRNIFITFDSLKEMSVWTTWNRVASAEQRYEYLPLIRKDLYKKISLQNAELFLFSGPSHSSPTELNIQLLKKKAKRKAIHQSKLNLASTGSSSPSILNSHLAKKGEGEKIAFD